MKAWAPWKFRTLLIGLLLLYVRMAISSHWPFIRAVDCALIGWLANEWLRFERQERIEHAQDMETLMPWYTIVVRIRCILASGLPPYLLICLINQQLQHTSFDEDGTWRFTFWSRDYEGN